MLVQKRKTGFIRRLTQRSTYAYVNARVRVRKSRLLPRDSYLKLLKMDIPEITRFIEATEYGREINELASRFSGIDLLENSLNVNEERNYAQIRELATGEPGELVGRYLERYRYWNIKTILRGRIFGATSEQMQRELLIENREDYDFYRRLMDAEGAGLAYVLDAMAEDPRGAEAAKLLRPLEESHRDDPLLLQRLEDALDRAYYTRLLESIPRSGMENQLFLAFVRKEIDTVNLSMILRFEWRDDPSTRVLEFLLPQGLELSEADLRRLAEASNRSELVERLKEYRIHEDLKGALAKAQETNSLVPVQIALKKSLGDFAQRFSHRNPLSVLPIINYLMRKHHEVRNLRAIARGKMAGLAEGEIENLLVVV
jgi:V/A-type H+/Na+-transporting ATPase subunit C